MPAIVCSWFQGAGGTGKLGTERAQTLSISRQHYPDCVILYITLTARSMYVPRPDEPEERPDQALPLAARRASRARGDARQCRPRLDNRRAGPSGRSVGQNI